MSVRRQFVRNIWHGEKGNCLVIGAVFRDTIQEIDDQALVSKLEKNEKLFTHSRVYRQLKSEYSPNFRSSFSLKEKSLIETEKRLISAYLERNRAKILTEIGVSPFFQVFSEIQCLAYKDSQFFKRHVDYHPSHFFPRRISWAYYFYKKPKSFEGGSIAFFGLNDWKLEISPESGTIVVFSSRVPHQVEPVEVRSKLFEDSRFVIVGFVHGLPTLFSLPRYFQLRLNKFAPGISSILTHGFRRIRALFRP